MADLLSWQSIQALGFVGVLVAGAAFLTVTNAPKQAPKKITYIFIWLAFDALCHLILEGSWLYLSTGGRTVNASKSFLANLWKDYAKADQRWGWADPTCVSIEILTVLGAGPIAAYCAYLLTKNDPRYHFWAIVLSTGEIYGGFMTFSPEWLTGNKFLIGSSDFLLFYVYLCFMNLVWVFVPLYLLYDSYQAVTTGAKAAYVVKASLASVRKKR